MIKIELYIQRGPFADLHPYFWEFYRHLSKKLKIEFISFHFFIDPLTVLKQNTFHPIYFQNTFHVSLYCEAVNLMKPQYCETCYSFWKYISKILNHSSLIDIINGFSSGKDRSNQLYDSVQALNILSFHTFESNKEFVAVLTKITHVPIFCAFQHWTPFCYMK